MSGPELSRVGSSIRGPRLQAHSHAQQVGSLTEARDRILTYEACLEIVERVRRFARGGGDTGVRVLSWWHGELRWARNRVTLASDRTDISVTVWREVHNGTRGSVTTNQIDDASLEAAVRAAERRSRLGAGAGRGIGFHPPLPQYGRVAETAIWSDETYGLTAEQRAEVAQTMTSQAEAAGFVSAGYVEARAAAMVYMDTAFPELRTGEYAFWERPYVRWTQAQCSTTVRDLKGRGSGWAGGSSFDWGRIDVAALVTKALEKCRASRDPVALEPGRYTVILEPQAVADLLEMLVPSFHREPPEQGPFGPWHLGYDSALRLRRSKLGLRVADERITIRHDPADPDLGIVMSPLEWPGSVTWIENGVLTALGHQFDTALEKLEGWHRLRGPTGYRMEGGETSVDEMIRTTRRGLLVTRLSNLIKLDNESVLSTGLTRDGLWLIENGQITHAVKNFRFTESPLFMLNNVEQIGTPVPVFRPTREAGGQLTPAIVPPLKVREFSFTSLIDAI